MTNQYQIVVDENMPCIDTLFSQKATIRRLPGREICTTDLKNADALLCRSVTQVDQNLLHNTSVKFVGSATIGIDHLDTKWLKKNNIHWASAQGCNANAVAQYVISSICYWLKNKVKKHLQDIIVGIVGAGNVGSELARCLDILGVRYQLCDPPLQRSNDPRNLQPLKALMECDVLTFHVPITHQGVDKTYHLIDEKFLRQLSSAQLLINASRGAVANNQALYEYLQQEDSASVVLDVFENEPSINFPLAKSCLLATPHIAGHTLEGKLRGSYLIYQAFCNFFNLPIEVMPQQIFPAAYDFSSHITAMYSFEKTESNKISLSHLDLLLSFYDIQKDSEQLLSVEASKIAQHFDLMRKNYHQTSNRLETTCNNLQINSLSQMVRRDYSGWTLKSMKQTDLEQFPGWLKTLIINAK